MTMRADSDIPLFFGGDGELFGMLHVPGGPARRGVLMCAPFGQEAIRTHRLYRQLAQALAATGCAVLRFDYFGTGDSGGAGADVTLERCVADTVAAARALRQHADVEEVVAFGARLGASVAWQAAARADLDEVVAWDPVVDGDAYLAAMDTLQAALGADRRRFVQPRSASDLGGQCQGFALTQVLREQIRGIQGPPRDVSTWVLDSLPVTTPGGHVAAPAQHRITRLLPATGWDDVARIESAILSHPLIHAVTARLKEVA
jgi:uncharacterized protein